MPRYFLTGEIQDYPHYMTEADSPEHALQLWAEGKLEGYLGDELSEQIVGIQIYKEEHDEFFDIDMEMPTTDRRWRPS